MRAHERTGWRDQALSERHRSWGDDCPAVDLDFLMCEYNHGVSVAIVDYKHHKAKLDNVNAKTVSTLSGLHSSDGKQLPFFVVRYWPDTWAFALKAMNPSAVEALVRIGRRDSAAELPEWLKLTEQGYVRTLYLLRKNTLELQDRLTIARLNDTLPPAFREAA